MLSDDVFRSRLETTIASLRYWVPQIADAARIEESEGEGFWRISVTPKVFGACPFELMLRSSQHYDLVLGTETYEELPIESFDLFLPLAEAITAGRVVQRRTVSAATGAVVEVESIIRLADGRIWHERRVIEPLANAASDDGLEKHGAAFLPYHRDGPHE